MQGHIALATSTFPQGVGGAHLDALARRALWLAGLDYDHGTGHGVGSYLSVHEGPVSISRLGRPVPIAAGMILSNEPGFYLPDHYGIRLENLLLVQPAALPNATKPFLLLRDPDPRPLRPPPAKPLANDGAGAEVARRLSRSCIPGGSTFSVRDCTAVAGGGLRAARALTGWPEIAVSPRRPASPRHQAIFKASRGGKANEGTARLNERLWFQYGS